MFHSGASADVLMCLASNVIGSCTSGLSATSFAYKLAKDGKMRVGIGRHTEFPPECVVVKVVT